MSHPDTGSLPEAIGPYIVREQIGAGGMATVYRVVNPADGREYALKVLSLFLQAEGSALKRFRREAQTLLGLHHPHILPVYDFGEDAGTPYCVMKLLPGRTLRDELHGSPLPPEEVCRLTSQISGALDFAHARDIIHRDIKPSNILLDQDGKAYLADFGVAHVGANVTRLTESGSFIGTVAYASPEQCQGETLNRASDVYSLAVMVFEMLTGRLPFMGSTPLSTLKMHLSDPPPNPLSIVPTLPLALYAVLARALAKLPEERYPSAMKFSEALNEALGVRVITPGDNDMLWLYGDQPAGPSAHGFVRPGSALADSASEFEFDDVELAEDIPQYAFRPDEPAESAGPDVIFVGQEDQGETGGAEDFPLEEEFLSPRGAAGEAGGAEFPPFEDGSVSSQGKIAPETEDAEIAFDDVFDLPPRPTAARLGAFDDDFPAPEDVLPAALSPIRPLSPRPAARRGASHRVIYGSMVLALLVLIAAVGLGLWLLLRESGPELDSTARSEKLGLRFDYPHGWTVAASDSPLLFDDLSPSVILADQPVEAAGPYESAGVVLALQYVNPLAVYGVPVECQAEVVRGPLPVFECMEQHHRIVPAFDAFSSSHYDGGVRLAGTLPPTQASWPMILLPGTSKTWLGVIIVHWNEYDNAHELLDAVAGSVRPLE